VNEISREQVEQWLATEERLWKEHGHFSQQMIPVARWALQRDAVATETERRLKAARRVCKDVLECGDSETTPTGAAALILAELDRKAP
jgi:hypothetical protein